MSGGAAHLSPHARLCYSRAIHCVTLRTGGIGLNDHQSKAKSHSRHQATLQGLLLCVEFCPQHILYQTDETNTKGYQLVAVTDPDKCTGCGMCSRVCPEFAIFVETADGKQ